LENVISAFGKNSHHFGAAKPFAIVAHRGHLFEVAFNNRNYMAAPKCCEFSPNADIKFSNLAQ
jgi:hypothetical protein